MIKARAQRSPRPAAVTPHPLTHLPTILRHAPIILYACDAAGICTFAYGRGLDDLGIAPEMLIGQSLLGLYAQNARRTAELDDTLPGLWNPEERVTGHVDFGGRVVHFSRVPVQDDGGELLGVIGVALDGTERVRVADPGPDLDERFRTVFNETPMGMAILDASGRCVQVNEVLCTMLGRGRADILAERFSSHVLRADRGAAWETPAGMTDALSGADHAEVRLQRSDDSVVHALIDVTALHHGPDEEPTHFLLHIQDFTVRREMEEAVRRSEAWLRTVLANAPVAIFTTDSDATITLAEGSVLERWHLDHLIGMNAREALAAHRGVVDCIDGALTGRASTVRLEVAGNVLQTHIAPLRDGAGPVRGVIGVATDVTDSMRSQRARQEAEARLLKVVNSAPIAVFAFDTLGVVTMAAGHCLPYLGMTADEVLGRSVFSAELSRLDLADRARVAVKGEEVSTVVIRDDHAFDLWFGPIHDDDHRIVGGFGIANDITELHRAHQDRRHFLSHIVAAQEAERARIAYDIHDDSLQLMTAIGIRLEQLRRRMTRARDVDLVACITTTLGEAIDSLRGLLVELGRPKLDGRGLAASIAEQAGRALDGTGIRVVIDDDLGSEPDPECSIVVYRVAQEALANVRKHAAASTVTVRLHGAEGGVLTSIDDDGVGFSIAQARLHPQDGHLGLTSMRERADIAGGWLAMASQPGRGTSLRYWIPYHSANGSVRQQGLGIEAETLVGTAVRSAVGAGDHALAKSDGDRLQA